MNCDLTEFVNDYSGCRIISDTEGLDIIYMSIYSGENYNGNILVCGDMIDSTLSQDNQKELEDAITKNNFDDIRKVLEIKSNNLKNIYQVLTSKKIRLVFGNRDLNKFKCKWLCKLFGKSELIDKFNNGNIDLTVKTYKKLKTDLNLLLQVGKKIWNIPDMTSWYPFWNPNIGKGRDWTKEVDYSQYPFLMRYYDIFGVDNAKINGGTISAQNLLWAIPIELLIDKFEFIEEDSEVLIGDNLKDFYAFVVLAIFNSMLLDVCASTNIDNIYDIRGNNSSGKIINTNKFCGWLTTLYREGYSVCYAKVDKYFMIFSHGGVTNRLLSGKGDDNGIIRFYDELNRNKDLQKYLTNAKTIKYESQTGGYYEKTTITYTPEEIKRKLENINNFINTKLLGSLKKDLIKPDIDVLFSLTVSAPLDCDRLGLECSTMLQKVSPVLSGLKELRVKISGSESIKSINSMFGISGMVSVESYNTYSVVQVVGHIPISYAPVVDIYHYETDNIYSYVIGLDNSNSFVSTKSNNSYLSRGFVDISNNNISIQSEINLSNNAPVVTYDKKLNINTFDDFDEFRNKIILDTDISSKRQFRINTKLDEYQRLFGQNNPKIYLNGTYEDKDKKYAIFTVDNKAPPFAKSLYILTLSYDNNTDFNDKSPYNLFLSSLEGSSQAGGLNDYYKNKYIKYKNKYIQLRYELTHKLKY